ncbi:Hypothetical predicted protein [Paramuricea clavata]|uniref:Uncharacterized protein n=1 Tax=Paramuricea clavata TaxID=317549 RepID=A0A7D9IDD6_PARCT|nr:Hypothetical predicted protein [Paramuricea clavata]
MEGYLNNQIFLGRLVFVLQALGEYFLLVPHFCGVMRRYIVHGDINNGEIEQVDDKAVEEGKFYCETRGLLYLDREQSLVEGFKKTFHQFHEFTLSCGSAIGTILISKRTACHRCGGKLLVEGNGNVVVFYHIYFGSYLGSRVKKSCRKCKVYEHYGG